MLTLAEVIDAQRQRAKSHLLYSSALRVEPGQSWSSAWAVT